MATTPPSSCVAREWTDFGKAVGRYDGEGAIATCRGRVAVLCDRWPTREGRTCCDRPYVATAPSPSCVARELTDFGKAVGRYDGEGAPL